MTARWPTFDLVIHRRSYPSGNQPFIPQPRKAASAPRLRFVLLASKNSKDSRWVPWELGVADGYKGLTKIALFPASDSAHEQAWASWEYLGLYRRIVWGDLQGHQKRVWMVLDEKRNTATELSEWLAGE